MLVEGQFFFEEMQKKIACSASKFKTPQQIWTGKPAGYDQLKVFSCTDYAHQRQDKLDPGAWDIQEEQKVISSLCIEKGPEKYIVSRDVVFNENEMPLKQMESHKAQKEASIEVESFGSQEKQSNSDTSLSKDQYEDLVTEQENSALAWEA